MKILFGVFELGLGHATRCLPLINELSKKNEVHIISTGRALKILKENFKDKCKYYDIPGIHSWYNSNFFKTNFVFNIHKILYSLKKARIQSKIIIDREKFDLVISDCRYDIYDTNKNSFLINHQLRLIAPKGVQGIIERYLFHKQKEYRKIIVPDFKKNDLSGKLSHDLKHIKEENIEYIGILSHVKKLRLKEDIDLFISLSGPEKTRIKLEKEILSQIKSISGKIIIAGGNPDNREKKEYKNIIFYSYLNNKQQEDIMNRSKFLIIRAGYTTIMELAELEKKALLIPSPGQTEQEYLTKYLMEKNYFYSTKQKELNILKDLEIAKNFKGYTPKWKTKESVKNFMKAINLA